MRIRTCCVAVLVAAAVVGARPARAAAQPPAPPAEALLDRTLAIIGGAVVTQSDATLAEALQLLDPPAGAAGLVARLVDRWLMLHEVARFAPAEPEAALVVQRLADAAARVGGQVALIERLTREGRSLEDLEVWVRDDLRIAAYLEQRFASASMVAEADVTAWVEANAAELARRGVTGADGARVGRDRLQRERRAALIADWLADLRRRVDVQIFPG